MEQEKAKTTKTNKDQVKMKITKTIRKLEKHKKKQTKNSNK